MSISEQWSALEMKDAQTAKYKAATSANTAAVLAAEAWIQAIKAAPEETISAAALACRSIAPDHRRRAHKALGCNANRYSMKMTVPEVGRQ